MGFLIDTNLWIAIERGALSPADIHAITKQEPVYLSPVNVAEIRFGIELINDPAHKQRALHAYRKMSRKPHLRITRDTGDTFGVIAAQLAQAGRGADFRVQDDWLPAQAIQRDFTILTANRVDFEDIPGLKFIEVTIP